MTGTDGVAPKGTSLPSDRVHSRGGVSAFGTRIAVAVPMLLLIFSRSSHHLTGTKGADERPSQLAAQ
jgi:hypothetical protein